MTQNGVESRHKAASSPRWYRLTEEELLRTLETSLDGLGDAQVSERQLKYGPNELIAKGQTPWWNLLLDQFKNVLILVLLVATALSAALGHALEAIAIAVIVAFAILLSFIQNFRAEKAIEKLRHLAAPNAEAIRSGKVESIPARDLVPGDVIRLKAGDRIPADGRLLSAINLRIDESPLTGESIAVEKATEPIEKPDLPLGDQVNMVFAGTNVNYGRGTALVTETGMNTQFGKIATLLETIDTSPTPLQVNLDRVGKYLAQAALVIVTIVAAIGIARGQPLLDTFVFAIALAVAVVPEALPAVVTISLAIGVQHLIKRNALIRRLPAVETLGATSVICSDKTGTLTKDEMTIQRIYTDRRDISVSGIGYTPEGSFHENGKQIAGDAPLNELLTAGVLSSDATLLSPTSDAPAHINGDPTEGALVVAAAKAGLRQDDLNRSYPRIFEIPFSSETKRMTTLHQDGDHLVAYSKGAPEMILPTCRTEQRADTIIPLDDEGRQRILDAAQHLAQQALRVLALAKKTPASKADPDQDQVFLGLVGMIDPPRDEAKSSIGICHQAGIKVVMITGDHPITAQAIARDLNIMKEGILVDGVALEQLDDSALLEKVEQIEVYARVNPSQKLRIIKALQARHHITAMTGDGVNDAPALKKADLGIAMGITGTDVSKEAADMTLTDDNFVSIVGAIEEGRGIYANIRKYLAYLLSANIGEIGLITTVSAIGFPMPLTAVQILYVNLATDGLPALALAVDPPESDQMRRKPRDSRKGIFTKPMVTLMCVGGVWSTIINLGVYLTSLKMGYSQTKAMTFTFVTLVLIQFLKAYNFRSVQNSALRKPWANKWLNLAVTWELVLLFFVVHWSVLQTPFGTNSLTAVEWLVAVALSATIFPVLEVTKVLVKRWQD